MAIGIRVIEDSARPGSQQWVALSNVQLEWLEAPSYGGTAGAFSAGPLLPHQNIDTSLTEPTYTLCAGIRFPEEGDALTGCAVDLCVLGGKAGRRVRQAA